MHKRTREQDVTQGLDVAFGFTCLTGLAGLAGATIVARGGGEPRSVLIVGCLTLLCSALIGLAARAEAGMAHRHALARVYAQLHQNQADPAIDRRLATGMPYAEAAGRLANATFRLVRMALMPGSQVKAWALAMQQELTDLRMKAALLAARLEADSHTIGDAARDWREARGRLAEGVTAARRRMAAVTAATEDVALAIALGNQPDLRALQNRQGELRALLDELLPRSEGRADVASASSLAQERLPEYSAAIRDMVQKLPILAE
jgi:hypothetical protein